MTTIEVVDAMLSLISGPTRWTRGAAARNCEGVSCDPCSPSAVCWCVYGSLDWAADADPAVADETDTFLVKVAREERPALFSLAQLNDDLTASYEDIVALLTRARERLAGSVAA